MLSNLFRPFSYLTIDHKDKKKVDWAYPICLSTLTVLIIYFFRCWGDVGLYIEGGLISKIIGFVQTLPGFYIAALAAIATFNKPDIDMTMPSPAPKIDVRVQGKKVLIDLTRRRFLCLMFSFLTAQSIIIILLGIFAQTFYKPFNNALIFLGISDYAYVFSLIFLFGYLILFWQMILASFWGLFYLGERLHQPDN